MEDQLYFQWLAYLHNTQTHVQYKQHFFNLVFTSVLTLIWQRWVVFNQINSLQRLLFFLSSKRHKDCWDYFISCLWCLSCVSFEAWVDVFIRGDFLWSYRSSCWLLSRFFFSYTCFPLQSAKSWTRSLPLSLSNSSPTPLTLVTNNTNHFISKFYFSM